MIVRTFEFHLQGSYFLLKVSDKFKFWVYILIWLILDVRCFSRIIERAYILISIGVTWGETCNHERVRVSPQTLFKQTRQFTVTVGNVCC